MIDITIILFLIYLLSAFGCAFYMADKDIDINIFTLSLTLCPLLNTYFAFKNVDFKDTINKLKGGKK